VLTLALLVLFTSPAYAGKGGTAAVSLSNASAVLSQTSNVSFPAGTASVFAQQHLVNGACP